MTKREQIVELLRCAADVEESQGVPSNLVDVARDLGMKPYQAFADTRVVQSAFNRAYRIWCRENWHTWHSAQLEAAARVEEGSWP